MSEKPVPDSFEDVADKRQAIIDRASGHGIEVVAVVHESDKLINRSQLVVRFACSPVLAIGMLRHAECQLEPK